MADQTAQSTFRISEAEVNILLYLRGVVNQAKGANHKRLRAEIIIDIETGPAKYEPFNVQPLTTSVPA